MNTQVHQGLFYSPFIGHYTNNAGCIPESSVINVNAVNSDWPQWVYDLQNELRCGLYSSDKAVAPVCQTDRVIYDPCVCLQRPWGKLWSVLHLLSSPPVELLKGKEGEVQRSTGKKREWKTSGGGNPEEVMEKKDYYCTFWCIQSDRKSIENWVPVFKAAHLNWWVTTKKWASGLFW